MNRTSRLGRLTARGTTIAVAALLAGGTLIGSAVAATEPAGQEGAAGNSAGQSTDPGVTHPELDNAGSTIRAHEGGETEPIVPMVTRTPGLDVSGYQPNVNWGTVFGNGGRFAYMKSTEGTGFFSPSFNSQYLGSYQAGLVRGAYHFALPNVSSGATQAGYFVAHGGGWSKDGKTLPPMLDIEYNPYGAPCYGLSQASMRGWIQSFSDTVHAKTSRYPTIYTSYGWWSQCTGNWGGLGSTNPLFIARYTSSPGTLPAGWGFWTIWQFNDHGVFPGDQDAFNGALDRVQALANG